MNEITIERIGDKGDGMAPGGAFAFTLPGEVIKNGEVIKSSPDRVKPICSVFGSCGGCKLQHWQHEPYVAWKTSRLANALSARGMNVKLDGLVPAHGSGRRRVTLHVREVGQLWQAGFMAEGSHKLVPLDQCPILDPGLRSVPATAAKFGAFFGPCDVTATLTDGGIDMAIKAPRKNVERSLARFDALMRSDGLIRITVNGETLGQQGVPSIMMGEAQVPLPPGCFLQATQEGETVLAALVLTAAKKSKRILDLFCGVGPFSLRLARGAAVHGIDSDKPAISALISGAHNTQGSKPVTGEIRDLFRNPVTWQELKEYDCVVLDPPRAGAEAQVQAIAKSALKKVIYVSCDPQTLARDAALLCAAGFSLGKVTPVDQFLYSAHLETVAVFMRP